MKNIYERSGNENEKTLIMKIISSAVCAAVTIAGSVTLTTTDAVIGVFAENSAYAVEADAEDLAVNHDAQPAGKTEKAAGENGTEGAGAVLAADEAAEDEPAEDGAAGKSETAAAAASETAGTEGAAQTAQTAQNSQTAQNTQTSQQTGQPMQSTTQPANPAPAPQPDPTPAPQYCGYCNAVFYSETEVFAHIDAVHFAPAPALLLNPRCSAASVCRSERLAVRVRLSGIFRS